MLAWRKLLIWRYFLDGNPIVVPVVVRAGMAVSVVMPSETANMKMRTLGMSGRLGHSAVRVRMRERQALDKLQEHQDGRDKTTHHHLRLHRQFSLHVL